jgi:dihydroorotate dehydrogenase electron transfer subunit
MNEPALNLHAHDDPVADFPIVDSLTRVVSNDWVSLEYKHLVLEAEQPATLALPGQFFNLLCPASGTERPFLRRPMSIYGADARGHRLEFLYRLTGVGTRGLGTLRPDDPFKVFGPLGKGFVLDGSWRNIVVVSRGVGLATLAPLAQYAAAFGVKVTAILSARSPDHVLSVDRFKSAGARTVVVTDHDGSSDPGNVETIVRGLVRNGQADAFFTCGSNRLMLLLQWLGREYGIPGQVAMEQQMACGLGMCFCCVRRFKVGDDFRHRRVCIEGPVFDLQEATSW